MANNLLMSLIEDTSDDSEVDELLEVMEVADEESRRGLKHWKDFSESQFRSMCRFEKNDLQTLRMALLIPDELRSANGYLFNGDDALCITLRRLAYPCRLYDVQQVFGLGRPQLSICVNQVCQTIFDNWSHLLRFDDSRFSLDRLLAYSAAISASGCPLGGCIGFIDGTLRPMCRPVRGQRAAYNGHKRVHGIKFQSVVTPDGIISHLNGPYEGTRHDSAILTESGLLDMLELRFQGNNGRFCVYGDAGYPVSAHIVCPFKGARLTADETEFNKAMCDYRIAVEWAFGKVTQQFAFVDFKKNMKLLLQPIALYYMVSVLLTNCHTALYGSQIADLFHMRPPMLHEYLV